MRSASPSNVLIAGDSYDRIVPAVRALLTSGGYRLTISEGRCLGRLPRLVADDTQAVVLFLTDADNCIELRDLVTCFPATAFLFVAPRKPARAALARLANTLRAGLVTSDDAPVVLAATLTSLLAQHAASLATIGTTLDDASAQEERT